MNNKKIGVFDSGVGGLTVLSKLHGLLPEESFIYIGDNLHSPYGEKSVEALWSYATQIIRYFQQQDVKMVVLACNTTSCTLLSKLQTYFAPLPIIGVIDATVKMVKANPFKKVAVMATRATIENGAYQKSLGENCTIGIACPRLVPMIEQGAEKTAILSELHQRLDQVALECDGVILGCTHYPIVADQIHALYPHLHIYSSSDAVGLEVETYLQDHALLTDKQEARSVIYTTGDLEQFKRSSENFFDYHDFDLAHLEL